MEILNRSFFSFSGWGIDLDCCVVEWFALEMNKILLSSLRLYLSTTAFQTLLLTLIFIGLKILTGTFCVDCTDVFKNVNNKAFRQSSIWSIFFPVTTTPYHPIPGPYSFMLSTCLLCICLTFVVLD